MNRNATDRIAATFTDEPVNHDLEIRLPGAVVEFLLRWAEVGLEKGDALPATASWLEVIRDEVDNQILLRSIRAGSVVMTGEEFLARFGTPESNAPADEVSVHTMTDNADGSVSCTCGVTSQRFGTVSGQRAWKSAHRRAAVHA